MSRDRWGRPRSRQRAYDHVRVLGLTFREGISMRSKLCSLAGVTAVIALALPAVAGADMTLGTTTQPTGSAFEACGTGVMAAQFQSEPSTSYTVPAPGGEITQWQTNTAMDTAGAALELVVLRATGEGSYTIVAV